MKTAKQTIEFINQEFSDYLKASEGISKFRGNIFQRIVDQLESKGFPKTESEKMSMCLVPSIFQEANYDGIDWSKKDSNYYHLQSHFDLDLIVYFEGKERSEITDDEYDQYREYCHRTIDKWKR